MIGAVEGRRQRERVRGCSRRVGGVLDVAGSEAEARRQGDDGQTAVARTMQRVFLVVEALEGSLPA